MMENDAFAFLEQTPLHSVCLTEPLRHGQAEVRHAGPDGVVLFDRPSGSIMVAAAEDAAERLPIPACALYQTTSAAVFRRLLRENPAFSAHVCTQFVYEGRTPLPEPEADIRPLGMEAFDVIHETYQMIRDPGFIRGRLESGTMLGVFADGALAGFAGVHEEGAMGMLEVLPAYRRRGFGRALTIADINAQLRRGWIPFGQVIEGNEPSLALQRALMTETGTVYWLY